jgi:uncharacterized membrane protein YwaF
MIWACLILGALCELEKIAFFIEDTGYGFRLPAEHLPFNLCSLQLFFMSILAFSENPRKRKALISFMFPTLIGGGFLGMVIPSMTFNYHGLMDLATYRYFFYHAMLIFLGFYLYLSKPIYFGLKSFGYALALIWGVAIFVVWTNSALAWNPKTNFCFFVRPPTEGLPLLNMDSGWLAYMLVQKLMCMIIFILCYLPVFKRELPKLIARRKHG